MMWWYGNGNISGWEYALITLSMVLFWAAVIYGVAALVRYLGRDERPSPAPSGPEDLLAERFARGEIDEPEYRRRLHTLGGWRPTSALHGRG